MSVQGDQINIRYMNKYESIGMWNATYVGILVAVGINVSTIVSLEQAWSTYYIVCRTA